MARRRVLAGSGQSRLTGAFSLRLVLGLLLLLVVILLALAGVGVGLTYYVITTVNSQESVTPQTYLLSTVISLNFTDRSGGEHEGWLLFGLRGAPAIILCPGYDSNRSDLLSLGSMLRDNHFNVYIFNFHGPKAKEPRSNLGPRQASDLMAAIDTVTKQPDVNPNRVGVFGTSVGGYAALVAAELNPKVKALAVDTTYPTPEVMFDSQVDRLLGGSSRFFHILTEAEFHLATLGGESYAMPANLSKLAKTPKLFISGRDNRSLAAATEELYNQAPEPKQLLVMEHSASSLATESEKREFEDQVLNFFQQKLSLRAN
jgi:esterase/lipase